MATKLRTQLFKLATEWPQQQEKQNGQLGEHRLTEFRFQVRQWVRGKGEERESIKGALALVSLVVIIRCECKLLLPNLDMSLRLDVFRSRQLRMLINMLQSKSALHNTELIRLLHCVHQFFQKDYFCFLCLSHDDQWLLKCTQVCSPITKLSWDTKLRTQIVKSKRLKGKAPRWSLKRYLIMVIISAIDIAHANAIVVLPVKTPFGCPFFT